MGLLRPLKPAEEKLAAPMLVAPVSGVAGGDAGTDAAALVNDSMGLTAEVVRREIGGHASLGEALAAARHAVEAIDPAGPHARGADYFAANPGQQLRAWFSGEGVELASGIPTPDGGEAWRFVMHLRAAGRGSALTGTEAGVPSAHRNRVEVCHDGITQWFENTREGLEHGFTLEEAPGGESGWVTIALEIEGGLQAEAIPEQDGARFVDADGAEVLHYTGLKAWDAEGRDLPARLDVRGPDTLALIVDDSAATYPVTIDPLFANVEARLVERSTAQDFFGSSVAVSGDTAVIGVPMDDPRGRDNAGSVYVLARSGTAWQVQARLVADDSDAVDQFGAAVAISGETVLVGADWTTTAAGQSAGSAYVFVRDGVSWSQQARLTPGDAAAQDHFGVAVALSGDSALIGAFTDDTPDGMDAGSAYLFVRSGTTWSEEDKLAAFDAAEGDFFGSAVALEGDTAVVGAPSDDTPGGMNAGSAYVFRRSGTVWNHEEKLLAPDAAADDDFGSAVGLSGGTAVIGSPDADTAGGMNAGAAHVFVRSGVVWSHQQKLGASDGAAGDLFGRAVAIDGESAVIGAPWQDTLGRANSGSAYVMVRSGTTWSQEGKLLDLGSGVGDLFGTAVALSGDTVLAGAPSDDTAAGVDSGSAHVFRRNATQWLLQARLTTDNSPVTDFFGVSLALDGETALIGAFADDTPAGEDAGSAYVFGRDGALWAQHTKLVASDGAAEDAFGAAVALSGGTAVIGASARDSTGGINAGAAYVFAQDGINWFEQAVLEAGDGAADDRFGGAVALDGDTALIGAPRHDPAGGDNAGSAYVFRGTGGTWSEEATLVGIDGATNDRFGGAVALDDDTAVVGARQANPDGKLDAGSAYVFTRNGATWTPQARLDAPDGEADDFFGHAVALDGDTIVVGAPRDLGPVGPWAGSAYVFARHGTSWSPESKLTASDATELENFGSSVSLAGNSVVVGAPFDSTPVGAYAGSAYVYSRSESLWNEQLKLTAGVDASAGDEFGTAVAVSGDIALIGAYADSTAGTSAGSAYVFLLGELPAITLQPQSRTVVPGQPATFRVAASGSAPLRYQWRKDGYPIAEETGTSLGIASAQRSDEGSYDCVVSNVGGVVTSAAATLSVNDLSEFAQSFPGAPAEANGYVLVSITPTTIGGAWRFVGEQQWRASGVPVGGLTTGDREIEFRPVPGYIQPPPEPVSVTSGGAATTLDAIYYQAGATGTGGLSVTLKPEALADPGVPEADRAQWRFLGEDGASWRDSGTSVSGLLAGNYLIECKPVTGRTPPPPASVRIEDGQTPAPVLTYFLNADPVGAPPAALPFETVTTSDDLPYAFVGQLRNHVGSGTGFVVKRRVVLTAGHMVFDDGTLATAPGLEWLFQRDRGTYEPPRLVPRGFYLFDGYSAARAEPGVEPGVGTPASQELDAAAVYFTEDAGRGGYGGFLASDAVPNEWMLSDAQKVLVGYPVDGVPTDRIGRMHATAATNLRLSPAGSEHTYLTTDIHSFGGNSGGPLCVQFEGGAYYPAAIYLGGSNQTVVRVIDREVIKLIDAAEDSSITGNNNTGGGITLTSVTNLPATTQRGSLQVLIEPPEARALAGWRLVTDEGTSYRASGSVTGDLTPGTYLVEFTPATGFEMPSPEAVQVAGGDVRSYTYTYAVENPELDAWRELHFGTTEPIGPAADDADPDGDGCVNIGEFTAGTDPNNREDCIGFLSMTLHGTTFVATIDAKAGRRYELQVSEAFAPGQWTTRDTFEAVPFDVPDATLTDLAALAESAFYRLQVTKP